MILVEPLCTGEAPPAEKGSSILAAVSVLANTVLGVGLVALPWCFSVDGLLIGCILLTVCACLSCFGLHLLGAVGMRMSGLAPEGRLTFCSVNSVVFPKARYAIDMIILIKSMGVATSYLLVIGDMFPDLAKQFFVTAPLAKHMNKTSLRSLSIVLAMIFLIVPASLPKRIRSMRFTNWLSVACMAYVAVMCVVLSLLNDGAVVVPNAGETIFGKGVYILPHSGPLRVLATVPVFIFSFTCHQNAFSVASELKKRTLRRLDIIAVAAISTSLVLYMTTALAGYLHFGKSVDIDLLNSYDSKWIAVRLGKLLVTMSIIFSFPMQCHPFRRSFVTLCTRGRLGSPEAEKVVFHISTVMFFVCTTTIALCVTDLGIVFELIGAICSNTLCYIAPSALYLRLYDTDEKKTTRVFAWCLLCLGIIILPLSLAAVMLKKQ